MSNLMSIEEMWEEFRSEVLKKNSTDSRQIMLERKKMFMAGVTSMLYCLEQCGKDDVSEEEGVDYLESLKVSLRDWASNLKRNHESLN